MKSLERSACRLSASISSACFIELAFTQRHCKTLCRLDSNSVLFPVCSASRPTFTHVASNIAFKNLTRPDCRRSAFSPLSNFAQVFHVAMHNIDCLHAVAPTPTPLPLNSFLSSFVRRQFHFTSRAAQPTFVTLFEADFPRTARNFFFFFDIFWSIQLALDKMTPFSAALHRQRLHAVLYRLDEISSTVGLPLGLSLSDFDRLCHRTCRHPTPLHDSRSI
jgi:hypothetical protein